MKSSCLPQKPKAVNGGSLRVQCRVSLRLFQDALQAERQGLLQQWRQEQQRPAKPQNLVVEAAKERWISDRVFGQMTQLHIGPPRVIGFITTTKTISHIIWYHMIRVGFTCFTLLWTCAATMRRVCRTKSNSGVGNAWTFPKEIFMELVMDLKKTTGVIFKRMRFFFIIYLFTYLFIYLFIYIYFCIGVVSLVEVSLILK